ncbi:hypothetical protein [Phaeodactylibacter luteus]|uniref:Uncharacterized protein n=1 Tax=Phaeodactylibacter luteus TaxID=1564516 RepID=A0A5C6RLA1_9BACT|nr:hypothetical protein [Phaeodactylibacter luteus]TXB63116.1 hypothetical protein FRY97_10685 [Phaeodactylibacter luteus]
MADVVGAFRITGGGGGLGGRKRKMDIFDRMPARCLQLLGGPCLQPTKIRLFTIVVNTLLTFA